MEPLQKQILTLSQKIDALYDLIEQLDAKVSLALSGCDPGKIQVTDNYVGNIQEGRYQLKRYMRSNSQLEHKDILADGVYPEINPNAGDKQITPEIQIQRLTTQLTAAYNRIAALEEQLLKQRIY